MHCVVSLCVLRKLGNRLSLDYKKYKLPGNAMRYSITVLNENYIENAKW